MPTYAAFLGHQPAISTAELRAVVPDLAPVRLFTPQLLLFTSTMELTPKHFRDWGGTVLLVQEIGGANPSLGAVPQIVAQATEGVKGKITFGLRALGVPPQTVRQLYRDSKALLVRKGRHARYVGNERRPAATALLHDSGMLDPKKGAEIVLLYEPEDEDRKRKEFLWIGKTVAAQDPTAYTVRDVEKPVRDTRVGLLPPKLAQILLNFGAWLVMESQPKDKKSDKPAKPRPLTVFDPFCGTGVIPMECLLRAWPVLASDASLKAVNGCEKNLEWLRKRFGILKKDTASTVWKQDALKPFELKTHPDVIVTETTLGPPMTARPNAKDAARIRTECEKIEALFLANAAATLSGVPIAATFPVWFLRSGVVTLEKVWKAIDDAGYRAILPPGVEPSFPGRATILYRRADQFVGREIVLLRPVKR